MGLFTPSPTPRKRPAQASDTGRQAKTRTPQSTRAESLASNSIATREPPDSTRRKAQNAKAGPSRLARQVEVTSTPPTRQSARVSRPSAKKAAGAEIVLSSDEDSDLPSPSSILRRVPKAPPSRPKKRKRASSPVKTQPKKSQQVICVEISDSEDDEPAKARPVAKRPKVTKNAAPEDIINLCSSSEAEGPPPSPIARILQHKSSPVINAHNSESPDIEVRKPKKPRIDRSVPTPQAATINAPKPDSHAPAPPSPQPEPLRAPSPQCTPSPHRVPSPLGASPPHRAPAPYQEPLPNPAPSPHRVPSPHLPPSPPPIPSSPPPQRLRIRNMRMVRTRSILSGRKFTRPEREHEIKYFEPDAQPQLNLLTHRFFQKSVASVKAKIEVQKRKKKKVAMSALASTSVSRSAPAPRVKASNPPETSLETPSSIVNAPSTLTVPSSLPLPLDGPPDVSVEQAEPETMPSPKVVKPPTVTTRNGEPEPGSEEINEPIHLVEPTVEPTSNDAHEQDTDSASTESPDIQDLITSAKHVTSVLDKLKGLRKCSNTSGKDEQTKSSPPVQPNTQSAIPVPITSTTDSGRTTASSSVTPVPADSTLARRRIPLPTRTSSVPAMKVKQNSLKPARDTSLGISPQLRTQSAPLTSSKSPLPSRTRTEVASSESPKPSIPPDTPTISDAPPTSTPTTTTPIPDKLPQADDLQHQSPPSPSPLQAQTDCDAQDVVSPPPKPDALFPALSLGPDALFLFPEMEGDSAAYDDMSLSDLELVYPEDLA